MDKNFLSILKKLLLLIFFSIGFVELLYSQADNIFVAIKENTQKTAQHTEKGEYEYVTITISALAFLIAIVTLHYAKKTYHSQKLTELNTRKWSTEQERYALRNIANKIAYSFAILLTVEKMLLIKKSLPSEMTFYKLKIDVDRLHADDNIDGDFDRNLLERVRKDCLEFNDLIQGRLLELRKGFVSTDTWKNKRLKSFFKTEKVCLAFLLDDICRLHNTMWTKKEKKNVFNPKWSRAEKKELLRQDDYSKIQVDIPASILKSRRKSYNEYDNLYSIPVITELEELNYAFVLEDYYDRCKDKVNEWLERDKSSDKQYNVLDHPNRFFLDMSEELYRYKAGASFVVEHVSDIVKNFINTIVYEVYEKNEYDDDVAVFESRDIVSENLSEYYTQENGGTFYLFSESVYEFRNLLSKKGKIERDLAYMKYVSWSYVELLKFVITCVVEGKCDDHIICEDEIRELENKYGRCLKDRWDTLAEIVNVPNLVLMYKSLDCYYEVTFKVKCSVDPDDVIRCLENKNKLVCWPRMENSAIPVPISSWDCISKIRISFNTLELVSFNKCPLR